MILLDQRGLSECNGDAWRDEYGAIFIIFTIKEMMKLLHLGNKKKRNDEAVASGK